jgi:ArsR family transcriptional regulator, arsenate/arsenite/antimonite-responsive transcriptional repressor
MTPQHVMTMTTALADPTRLRILQAIAQAPERCCGELARDFPITQAAVSQHLKILTDACLVEPRRPGQFNYYRLRWDVFDAYQRTLATALAGAPALRSEDEGAGHAKDVVRPSISHITIRLCP